MVGDSPGDVEAAEANGTWFFPIIVGDEAASWKELYDKVADQFVAGEYTKEDHERNIEKFWRNLDN